MVHAMDRAPEDPTTWGHDDLESARQAIRSYLAWQKANGKPVSQWWVEHTARGLGRGLPPAQQDLGDSRASVPIPIDRTGLPG